VAGVMPVANSSDGASDDVAFVVHVAPQGLERTVGTTDVTLSVAASWHNPRMLEGKAMVIARTVPGTPPLLAPADCSPTGQTMVRCSATFRDGLAAGASYALAAVDGQSVGAAPGQEPSEGPGVLATFVVVFVMSALLGVTIWAARLLFIVRRHHG